MLICSVILLVTGELGSALDALPWPETSRSSEGPVTQHKKVRCFSENVKLGDDRNYEIEQIRKDVRLWCNKKMSTPYEVRRIRLRCQTDVLTSPFVARGSSK
jgi:hypothetical protein